MPMKETPLIDAAGKAGALPMPTGPFFSGLVACLIICLMGGFLTLFHSYTFSTGNLEKMYEMAHYGAYIAMGLVWVLIIGTMISLPWAAGERAVRLGFCFGAAVGSGLFALVDVLTYEWALNHLEGGVGP